MARKRSSGEGYVYKLPSGKWRAQICIEGNRLSMTRPSKGDAREWINEMQLRSQSGMGYQALETTLKDFMGGWLERKRYNIKPATDRQYTDAAQKYILPSLGHEKLIVLNPGRIQGFIDQLIREGIGRRTVQVVRIVLHICLRDAQALGLISRNPVQWVKAPKSVKRDLFVWNEQQVSQFLVAIKGERNEYLYHLALATGMRQGELLGLKWQDIDWHNGMVQVKRQAVEVRGGGFAFQEPKSRRGYRPIDLGIGLVEDLRKQIELVSLARQIAKNTWQENDLVFPSTVGTPQLGTNLDRDFKRLVLKSSLPKIRFHDLRHTAASIMLSRGIPPMIVAGMMGHSLNVLNDIYAHFIPSTQSEAARLMDEVISTTQLPGFLPKDK